MLFKRVFAKTSARLDESQTAIKIARRNINNLRYADDTNVMAENEEELKSLFMMVKEESEKFKKIMASGPITSLQIDGEKVEAVTDFLFLGSKITVDGDCSLEIKSCLLLGRKAMTNLDSILKSRDVTLPTKVYIPVITYRCESWALEKADTEELMLLDYGAGEDS